ncbi:MAG TPA: hypothetical protein DDW78_07765 [Treponema sp.]|nr:hypothetical protein [Treponema sp.]
MEAQEKTRKSNFELLRIVAMLMVVANHYADTAASGCYRANDFLLNRIVNSLYVPLGGGQTGVAIFFMLSGYFLVHGAAKKQKAFQLVITTVCYAWLSFIVFAAAKASGYYSFPGVHLRDVLATLVIPISSGNFWFITTYLLLYFISPLLNDFLKGLEKKRFVLFLLFCYAFWYILALAYRGTFGYYNLQRAVFFYAWGAYLRLYPSPGKRGGMRRLLPPLAGSVLCWLLSAAASYFRYLPDGSDAGGMRELLLLGVQGGVLTPLWALTLFLFFQRLPAFSSPPINKIASATFGIYLLHTCTGVSSLFYNRFPGIFRQYRSRLYPLHSVLAIAGFYAACCVFELLRQKIVRNFQKNKPQTGKTIA